MSRSPYRSRIPSAKAFARADGSGFGAWGSGLGSAIPSPAPQVPSPSVTNGAAATSASCSANARRVRESGMYKGSWQGEEERGVEFPILKDGLGTTQR